MSRRDAAWGDAIGRTYLVAGRSAEALPYLRRAASSCGALVDPLAVMHANVDLGAALEANGDVPGACAAYGRVLDQWASARPKAVTAEHAKRRFVALTCRMRDAAK
jgi:serine/threonine-protein kinase